MTQRETRRSQWLKVCCIDRTALAALTTTPTPAAEVGRREESGR